MTEYVQTSSSLAREAGVSAELVRIYANLGLLDYQRANNGMRLFRAGQADRVRLILAERLANRGRRITPAG